MIHTRRPQAPKSCSEFAMTCMPSQTMLSRSSSLYSSMTVGRKKTRRPPGFRRYLASTTRSAASADNSYGLVGGMYCWTSLGDSIGKIRVQGHVEPLDVHIRTRMVVGEEVNQAHAPFSDRDVLHLLGRRLQRISQTQT
jgi:hypothetical protein